MRNPSTRRAYSVRSGATALVLAAAALLALPAQAAWLVSDTQAQQILREIRDGQRNNGALYELLEDFRDKEQPENKWNGTGHKAVYKPYNGSKREGADYNYELLGVNMTARSRTEGMEAKCGNGVTADVPDNQLWQPPPMPSSGIAGFGGSDPQADQTAICQRLVVSENLRFNEYRRMLKRIQDRNEALKTMSQQRNEFATTGALSADTNNLQMFIADSQVEIQYSQAVIAAYDAQIARLLEAQDMHAKRALNGDEKATGPLSISAASLTRAGTLCAALTAFKSGSSEFNCGTIITDLF